MNQKVTVLAVGGTIAMTGKNGVGVRPELDASTLVAAVPELASIARIEARTVSTLPSCHLDLPRVIELAGTIQSAFTDGSYAVVVTHGTDALDESAFLLDLLVDADQPVVVTGAMRNAALPGADGPANLLAATRVAVAAEARGRGVMAVMDGRIHAARFVRKVDTSQASAFDSAPVCLGQVTDHGVRFFGRLPALPRIAFSARDRPAPVALLTVSMGDDGRLVDHLEADGYAGLVVAGMGGGHVPPAMAERLQRLAERMPVVVGSRVADGGTLSRTYGYVGGEVDLAARGMLFCGWLSPLKARLALSLLIGAGADRDRVRAFFSAFDGG